MNNAVANTEACLVNIERYNEITNAYITVMADQALEQATAIDAAAARGESDGLLAGLAFPSFGVEESSLILQVVGSIKAALYGHPVNVPFAGVVGTVTRLSEQF